MNTSIVSRTKATAKGKVEGGLRRILPGVAPDLMQYATFWPHDQGEPYARPVENGAAPVGATELPVPPKDFWAYYCTSEESFLRTGKEDVDTMKRLLADSGAPIEKAGRILELGSAGGRLIRWLAPLAPENELWGADLWSSAVLWCLDHLSPPINFFTSTTVPSLPFEDRSVGLIFAGSVFTHIDDLVETWFLELHRILKPGGRLYFTINDEHAMRVFDGEADPANYPRYYERTGGKESWDNFVEMIDASPEYRKFKRGDAYMVTLGRSIQANVMWNSDALLKRLSWGFRACSVTPEAYGHQTAVLLERI
jgi:SAM-dependent methyltransferase